ncbi:MAG: BrnT family toxin [Bdellovibrionaceae bacterium]|nr:BrnT family toxin [Pseudobdellovibrionaceae bacterium]
MSGLTGKRWYFFIWDEENEEHLDLHRIRPEEAEEVFFNRYVITPNKKTHGPRRYRIDGKTDGGRKLRLIFEDVGSSMARIITGWDL